MQTASKNLMETLSDIYEKEWVGQDMLYVQAQNHEMLWADLAHKLSDQVVIPLNTYQAQFPEMRVSRADCQSGPVDWRVLCFQKKIDKRGRKLIDFDKERHAVQQMQNNPNRNEAKFIKVKEQMENAKRTYEVLNSELHDELPALHDSRILFLVTNMQTLFAAEEVFHSETSKVIWESDLTLERLIITSILADFQWAWSRRWQVSKGGAERNSAQENLPEASAHQQLCYQPQ